VVVHQFVVELDALLAGDASQHDQNRLAAGAGLCECRRQIVVEPEPVGLDFRPVLADLLLTRLLLSEGHAGDDEDQQQAEHSAHRTPFGLMNPVRGTGGRPASGFKTAIRSGRGDESVAQAPSGQGLVASSTTAEGGTGTAPIVFCSQPGLNPVATPASGFSTAG